MVKAGEPERALRPEDINLETPSSDWVDKLQVSIARKALRHGGKGFYLVMITGPHSVKSVVVGHPEESVYKVAMDCLKEDIAMAEMK